MSNFGWGIVLGSALLFPAGAQAKDEPPIQPRSSRAEPPTPAPEATTPVASPVPSPAPAAVTDQQTKSTEAARQLNGTVWSLELAPLSGPPPKRPLTEVLRFEQGKLTAEHLATDGYPASNFTLSVGDDNIPVWETMQAVDGKGVVFWRGELHGETMQGILSKHPLEGATEDYSFAGHPMGAAPQRASAAAAPAATSSSPSTTGGSLAGKKSAGSSSTSEGGKQKKKKGLW